jgi:hypothetical protein
VKKGAKIEVKGTSIAVYSENDMDFISLTDMLRAKDGDFFVSDWLRNRNTVDFLGVWEQVHNPGFNYGEFAIIKSQAGTQQVRWKGSGHEPTGHADRQALPEEG